MPRSTRYNAAESRSSGKRPMKAMLPKDKVNAIDRVHSGESKAAVARDIGVPESTLRGWCKSEDKIRMQANQQASGKYEHTLTTSSSDNSPDNSRPGSSSRSTPTGQATILGLSTSGVADRPNEEPEPGPAPKRMKIDNLSPSAAANMSTSARVSTLATNDMLTQLSLYNLLAGASDSQTQMQSQAINFLNSFLKDPLMSTTYSRYPSSTNILSDSLQMHRNNGGMTNMTNMTNLNMALAANMMSVNNALLTNGNKRKYSNTFSSATNNPRSSRRQSSQSPNARNVPAGSISQPSTNNRTSPLSINNRTSPPSTSNEPVPSTSANNIRDPVVQHINSLIKPKSDRLDAIVTQLQPQTPRVSNIEEIITNSTVSNNNNNVDHVDHENANQNSLNNTVPPGFDRIVQDFTKCVDWLSKYGSRVCTFNQVSQMNQILENLKFWSNNLQNATNETSRNTNGTS
ncbi:protein distal antenna [Solenopsis invicta]|uniref:protein distal antenna n=1 Tax=Solenopsis invicta TaxID=13686 RepID=UPI00059633BF|nr:protein distal antenna [Solenopsis invicta]